MGHVKTHWKTLRHIGTHLNTSEHVLTYLNMFLNVLNVFKRKGSRSKMWESFRGIRSPEGFERQCLNRGSFHLRGLRAGARVTRLGEFSPMG
jgi:hypothetical protein